MIIAAIAIIPTIVTNACGHVVICVMDSIYHSLTIAIITAARAIIVTTATSASDQVMRTP